MTISSEVQVYNLALNAIGERSNISSPSENSRGAEVCRLWYSPVLDQILAAAPWPEATEIRYLALLREADDEWSYDDPRPGYSYVYGLPSDYIRASYLTNFSRFLVTSYSDNRRAIHTNTSDAALAYVKRLTNVALMSADLQMALVYGLAAHICMPITGKTSRARELRNQANELIWAARETAANTSNEFNESTPDWIAARGYSSSPSERFFNPYGSLLTVAGVN